MSELRYALEAAAKSCERFPTVADIRKLAEDHKPEPKEYAADEYCTWCGGSGWETVADDPYQDHPGGGVARCRCRQPGYVRPLPPAESPFSDEERQQIADALADKVL